MKAHHTHIAYQISYQFSRIFIDQLSYMSHVEVIMHSFSQQNPDVYTYVLYQFWLDSVATVLRLSLVTLPLPIRQRTFIRNYVFIFLVTSCFPSLATLYLQPTSFQIKPFLILSLVFSPKSFTCHWNKICSLKNA